MSGNPELKRVGRPDGAIRYGGAITKGVCVIDLQLVPDSAVAADGTVDPSKCVDVQAVIDTGATQSAVRADVAAALGMVEIATRPVKGATTMEAKRFSVVSGTIAYSDGAKLTTQPVEMIIAPIDCPMLFGMPQVVTGFLAIDGAARVWRWHIPSSQIPRR